MTIVTNSKKEVVNFINTNNFAVITKPLISSFDFFYESCLYTTYTELVDDSFLQNLEDKFHPSLFQEYISKEVEIRSFFIDKTFYTMAYFSQQLQETSIDYKKGNGNVRFKTEIIDLPQKLKKQLIALMERLDLITGSFDLIYTDDNSFVFLEVNPAGIFENISYLGNFNIEQKIAKTLMKYDKNGKR